MKLWKGAVPQTHRPPLRTHPCFNPPRFSGLSLPHRRRSSRRQAACGSRKGGVSRLNQGCVWVKRGGRLKLHKIRSFQYNLIRREGMISENIFIEAERWVRYAHPLQQLEDLRLRGTPQQIKNYFTNKNMSAFMLKQISGSQVQKSEASLRTHKLKQIFKEKAKKLGGRRGAEAEGVELSAKSSSKTNIWSEEDQEVSQYLICWEQEDLPSFRHD